LEEAVMVSSYRILVHPVVVFVKLNWKQIPSLTTSLLEYVYRICMCKNRTFWQEFTPQNWCAAYTPNIVSFWRLSPRRRYCTLWNSQWRPLVFETVILQTTEHARMRQRITGVSTYFDYMRVADTIDSQKSEDYDITDKLP
jgi:hypothetical protein